jgi:glycosyltransferase involved in cell wall biosynthesis
VHFVLRSYKILREIAKKQKIDDIHCLYPNSSVVAAVLMKWFSPRQTKPVIIYDLRSPWLHIAIERGSIPSWAAYLFKKLGYFSEFILSLWVDKFIFITQGLKEFYTSKLRMADKPSIIIPSGIHAEQFIAPIQENIRTKLNIADNQIVLGYIGGIAKLRKLHEVIEACTALDATKYRVMIVGSGDALEDLRAQTKELGLQDVVIFTGVVPHSDINDYVQALDVGICHIPDTFVFRRSFPMKVLEYLAAGIPVLATDIRAHREIAKDFPGISLYKDTSEFIQKAKLVKRIKIKTPPKNIAAYDWKELARKVSAIY